jgi:hypothetical protein
MHSYAVTLASLKQKLYEKIEYLDSHLRKTFYFLLWIIDYLLANFPTVMLLKLAFYRLAFYCSWHFYYNKTLYRTVKCASSAR